MGAEGQPRASFSIMVVAVSLAAGGPQTCAGHLRGSLPGASPRPYLLVTDAGSQARAPGW